MCGIVVIASTAESLLFDVERAVVPGDIPAFRLKFSSDVRPNITGNLSLAGVQPASSDSSNGQASFANGAFSSDGEDTLKKTDASTWSAGAGKFYFSANASNSAYGNSSTIQPNSIRSLCIVKF